MEEVKERKEVNFEEEETQTVEEALKGDDFRYTNRSKQDTKGSNKQSDNDEEDVKVVEDDNLSYLGEEIEEEEGLQVGKMEEDQPGTYEEEGAKLHWRRKQERRREHFQRNGRRNWKAKIRKLKIREGLS